MKDLINKLRRSIKNRINAKKPVQLLQYSQPYTLSARAESAGLTHDQKAIVDIGPVRMERDWNTEIPTIYFCPTDKVVIKKVLQPGDGGKLPEKVQLINIRPPKKVNYSGIYFTLKNVMLHSNGVITLASTPETEWAEYTEA